MNKKFIGGFSLLLVLGWAALLWLDLGIFEPTVHWLVLLSTIAAVYLGIFIKMPHGKYGPEGIERFFMWVAPVVTLIAAAVGFTAKMEWLPEMVPAFTSWPVIMSAAPLGVVMLVFVFSAEAFGGLD